MQRECGNLKVFVCMYEGGFLAVYWMDTNVIFSMWHKKLNLCLQHWLKICRNIEVYAFVSTVERHGGEQADQSQTVVTVGVADKDVLQLSFVEPELAELPLSALPAVNHVELS